MALCAISCLLSEARVVKMPYAKAGNAYGFDIVEVELTKKETRLHLLVESDPEEPTSIAQGTYLLAGGRKYKLTKFEDLHKDKPTSDDFYVTREFYLWFEPMPQNTREFDFIEDGGEGRKLWNVSLTGWKPRIPARLNVKEPADFEAPAFKYATDSVTINLHILNYDPKMGNRLDYYVNFLTGQINERKPGFRQYSVDEQGNCTIRLLANCTGEFVFRGVGENNVYARVTVDPGETVDVWIDGSLSSYATMSERRRPEIKRAWSISNGRYRNYDLAMQKCEPYRMNTHSGKFADFHMTADEYTDHSIKVYRELLAKIDADRKTTAFQKKVMRNKLAADLIEATIQRDYLLMHNYWCIYKNFGESIPADSIKAKFTAEHTRRIAATININDPMLMFENRMAELATSMFHDAGVSDTLLYPLSQFMDMYKQAATGDELNQAAMDRLASFNIPFYTQLVERRHNEMLANVKKFDANKIQPTPDVADNEVFDAIIAPHKGKVVVIDVWETWCGPCREAIQRHEPHKKTTFAGKDVVWIYLASESSPKDDYVKMVQTIDGLHYRLTKAQSNAVSARFGIRFIPSYILVDREGKAVLLTKEEEENYEETILKKL